MIGLSHVHKRYLGSDTPALDDVTLDVGPGEFVVLAGPSGAGKSTLLRLLFAAERATAGTVELFGQDVTRMSSRQVAHLRRGIGVVFQDFKLLPDMSVVDNVALALEVQGLPHHTVVARSEALLSQVGLSHKLKQRAGSLSGGEQQRVALARALVAEPRLLLCDEPTGNLDAERAKDIVALLVQAHARGATVIVATHDLHLLETGQRLVRLDAGAIQSDVPVLHSDSGKSIPPTSILGAPV